MVCFSTNNCGGTLQWFLYRDRLGADCARSLQCRHPHQHDTLQGRVGGVRRSIPGARERGLVHLPQHRYRVARDFADIGRHQRGDHGRPSPRSPVTLHFTEQLPCLLRNRVTTRVESMEVSGNFDSC